MTSFSRYTNPYALSYPKYHNDNTTNTSSSQVYKYLKTEIDKYATSTSYLKRVLAVIAYLATSRSIMTFQATVANILLRIQWIVSIDRFRAHILVHEHIAYSILKH